MDDIESAFTAIEWAIQNEKAQFAHQLEVLVIAQLQVLISQVGIYLHSFGDNRQTVLAMTVMSNLIQQTLHSAQELHQLLLSSAQPTPPLPAHIHLTPRELDVIQCVVDGMSNKEIAHKLGMTVRTVKFHLDNIFTKLGVTSRTGVAMFAVQYGLV